MDAASAATIASICSGVATNALHDLIKMTAKEGRLPQRKLKTARTLLNGSESVQSLLQKAAVVVAKSPLVASVEDAESLRLFLVSPEMEAFTRQLFADQLSDVRGVHVDLVKQQFHAALSLYLQRPTRDVEELADALFTAIVESCVVALSLAAERSLLGAHEALAKYRDKVLARDLAVINANIAFLTSTVRPNVPDILAFEEKYRDQVKQRHSFIVPPNVDEQVKVPIDRLFVQPNLFPLASKSSWTPYVTLADVLRTLNRAVILGNPGGGKSTSALKVCADLSAKYEDRLCMGRLLSPVLVILREYGIEKKARGLSILQFIEQTARSRYQLEPPPGSIEYLLLNGRLLVLFDGLDELLDTADRREISADVESFCNAYPTVPVLATSREVGYEQAPLDENAFRAYRLSPFTDQQVVEYVRKWFDSDSTLEPEQRQQKAQAFVDESAFVPDLRSNPLMLSLMCRIYRGENYIPQNRPDVYEKCATMLFEQWDKGRGIRIGGGVAQMASHIRPAMMHLAHWIYETTVLHAGVGEDTLVSQVASYLHHRRYEDEDEAMAVAREFVAFLRGRAWVLSETGSDQKGEGLYQFTHRTFLEYFTAGYLVRTNRLPETLAAVLLPRIKRGEWDVVAQLALQIQNRTVQDAGDELLGIFLAHANTLGDEDAWPVLSFCTRALEFIVPRPEIDRLVVDNVSEWCVKWESRQRARNIEIAGLGERTRRRRQLVHNAAREAEAAANLLGGLVHASTENAKPISEQLYSCAQRLLTSGDHRKEEIAIDLTLNLWFYGMLGSSAGRGPVESWAKWQSFGEPLLKANEVEVLAVARRNAQLAGLLMMRGKLDHRLAVEWHGVDILFSSREAIFTPRHGQMSMTSHLLFRAGRLTSETNADEESYLSRQFEAIGRVLETMDLPWLKRRPRGWHVHEVYSSRGPAAFATHMVTNGNAAGAFALIALMAAGLESTSVSMGEMILRNDQQFANTPVGRLFSVRVGTLGEAEADVAAPLLRLSERNTNTLRGWAKRQMDFANNKPTGEAIVRTNG